MEEGITFAQFIEEMEESLLQADSTIGSYESDERRDFSAWFLDFMRFGLKFDGEVIDALRKVLDVQASDSH